MLKKAKSIISLGSTFILAGCLMVSAAAADCEIISQDPETGITVYRDAAGGIVISGMPAVGTASESEQQTQLETIEEYSSQLDNTSVPMTQDSSNYVDYEYNPIYIGTWSGTNAYARHTLGEYNASLKYLTSYGYVTYYNTKGNNALPYRNGNSTVASEAVVDVAKFSYFDIRDLETDVATTLQVTDWGPNQTQVGSADGCERIADLDKNAFNLLHGNTSDGVLYARTWVPIENYNP